jgi:hypothetical protein
LENPGRRVQRGAETTAKTETGATAKQARYVPLFAEIFSVAGEENFADFGCLTRSSK